MILYLEIKTWHIFLKTFDELISKIGFLNKLLKSKEEKVKEYL
jgi:hypothetical protein